MSGPTSLCPRCRGLNPDCGTCLGLGQVPQAELDEGAERLARIARDTFPDDDAGGPREPVPLADVLDGLRDAGRASRAPRGEPRAFRPKAIDTFARWWTEIPPGLDPCILVCFSRERFDGRACVLVAGEPTASSVAAILRDAADMIERRASGLPSQAVPSRAGEGDGR